MRIKIVKTYGQSRRRRPSRQPRSPPLTQQRQPPLTQRHLLAKPSEHQIPDVLVYIDFGSSKTVVAYRLDPNEEPDFLTHHSSNLNPFEIPGALTVNREDGGLHFEIGARGMHEANSHVLRDLKVNFWKESEGKYEDDSRQRDERLAEQLDCQPSELSPKSLVRTYLRLIRKHLVHTVQQTHGALPPSGHRYKLFAAYPGAWSSVQIYPFAEQARAAGFDECVMTITELQAQIHSPSAQKFFDRLDRDASGKHQIVCVDGGGSTTSCSILERSDDGSWALISEICQNYGGRYNEIDLADACLEYHLKKNKIDTKTVEEWFKRAYYAEVDRKDSGIWDALYDVVRENPEYNVIGDNVRVNIPSHILAAKYGHMKRVITDLIKTARQAADSTGSYQIVVTGGLSRWTRMHNDVRSELGSDCVGVRALLRSTQNVAEGLPYAMEKASRRLAGYNLGFSIDLPEPATGPRLSSLIGRKEEYSRTVGGFPRDSQSHVIWVRKKDDDHQRRTASEYRLIEIDNGQKATLIHFFLYANEWAPTDARILPRDRDLDIECETMSKMDKDLWQDHTYLFTGQLTMDDIPGKNGFWEKQARYFCVEMNLTIEHGKAEVQFFLSGCADESEKLFDFSKILRIPISMNCLDGKKSSEESFAERAEKGLRSPLEFSYQLQ